MSGDEAMCADWSGVVAHCVRVAQSQRQRQPQQDVDVIVASTSSAIVQCEHCSECWDQTQRAVRCEWHSVMQESEATVQFAAGLAFRNSHSLDAGAVAERVSSCGRRVFRRRIHERSMRGE